MVSAILNTLCTASPCQTLETKISMMMDASKSAVGGKLK